MPEGESFLVSEHTKASGGRMSLEQRVDSRESADRTIRSKTRYAAARIRYTVGRDKPTARATCVTPFPSPLRRRT